MAVEVVFLAGILSFFSPCTVPLLPVYFAELAGSAKVQATDAASVRSSLPDVELIFRTLVFVAGISTSFALLGFGAGFVGQVLGSQTFLIVCGIVVVLLGIHQTGLIRFQLLERQKKLESSGPARTDLVGAFLLGFTFSFGWTPCVGPVLATVLALASNQGQALGAAAMMLVYSAGLSVPFILIALFGHLALTRIKGLQRYLPKVQIASGVLIILMGILLMTNKLNFLAINF